MRGETQMGEGRKVVAAVNVTVTATMGSEATAKAFPRDGEGRRTRQIAEAIAEALSEVTGPTGVKLDVVVRTVDINPVWTTYAL